ncbi:hypothetical protein JG687_00004971 [Phytophthora cactorum]|uniref:Uncharacterized protein n=1 Tax=Phytophthora cactorum TaxID=29920 RepID=A0A329S326_9STRA|nr:hypothetical protein Pcac1_g9094 [Phytophthora cactorum]KAG2825891.1 hypothetical protein PC112_g9517 [Phytophthora cactorum]KAG2833181.1 hypothetical protein PC111_g6319 [Phytophthora cactorum]KAG2856880.1 hypothetical protein PC113_g11196 [Phytophthora cactorum]KAG2905041.1 hypothetical protein PC114_g11688 [Phytophthora cactorum]
MTLFVNRGKRAHLPAHKHVRDGPMHQVYALRRAKALQSPSKDAIINAPRSLRQPASHRLSPLGSRNERFERRKRRPMAKRRPKRQELAFNADGHAQNNEGKGR